jgi:hypothetical protein
MSLNAILVLRAPKGARSKSALVFFPCKIAAAVKSAPAKGESIGGHSDSHDRKPRFQQIRRPIGASVVAYHTTGERIIQGGRRKKAIRNFTELTRFFSLGIIEAENPQGSAASLKGNSAPLPPYKELNGYDIYD